MIFRNAFTSPAPVTLTLATLVAAFNTAGLSGCASSGVVVPENAIILYHGGGNTSSIIVPKGPGTVYIEEGKGNVLSATYIPGDEELEAGQRSSFQLPSLDPKRTYTISFYKGVSTRESMMPGKK